VDTPERLGLVDWSRLIVVTRTAGIVKGFQTPARHGRGRMHGGRRPKSLEGETAGEFAPAVVSVYGDLMRMFGLISQCRTGTTAEQVS
jgi:hypothetical protein